MSRLPYPAPESIPADVRAILDARPPRNVFRMLANAPALVPGVMELTGAILYRAATEPLYRELVILRVGHLCGSHYEVHQHEKIARAVGLADDKIAGTSSAPREGVYTGKERLVLELAEQVVRNTKAEAALFQAVTQAFGPEQTMELLVIIGTYVMLAQVLENAEVELEAGAGPSEQDVQKIFGSQRTQA
jgi:4-carboxymuconolactone decarboxylase